MQASRFLVGAFVAALGAALAAGCGDNRNTGASPDASPDDQTLIMTEAGPIQGSLAGASRQFLGIPYAAPPVGDLRWRPPQPAAPWSAARMATAFGPRCAQLAVADPASAASTDEDCLYLNVWTPSPPPPRPVAVMVWLHGGDNVAGSASEPISATAPGALYAGQKLAQDRGAIVVSLNYRLGVLGFLAHPALAAEVGTAGAGNQGLLDQQFALQWVHANIARFGGDPSNVTLFGQGGGALDVCLHVTAPSSAGLFHRALGQSGGCTTRQPTQAEAQSHATALATAVGCTGAGALACLRGKSAAELMAPPAAAPGNFGPALDGALLPDQPRTLFSAGQVAHVPYLLGSTTDEGTRAAAGIDLGETHEYKDVLEQLYSDEDAKTILAQYPLSAFAGGLPSPEAAAIARVIGDARIVCPTLDTALRVAHDADPVFLYNFDIALPSPPAMHLGAADGAELGWVFGTSATFTNETVAASELMQRYWVGFARTGDPNEGVDPPWPAFTEAANVRVSFAQAPSTVTDFRAAQCAFWRSTYDRAF